ncbi:MAG: ATP-dependent DNA helicase RecG [Lachnospiraceae bacterium]|nr:ATP-dependent DNA helicase RecG [Lachnospiraceae bacterium]
MLLSDDIKSLKGIADKTAESFYSAGLFNLNDLLHYFPRNYESLKEISPIAAIAGDGYVTLKGKVSSAVSSVYRNGKNMTQFSFSDQSGTARVSVFNMPWLKKSLFAGRELIMRVYAKRKGMQVYLSQPKFYTEDEYKEALMHLKAVYPLTKKLNDAPLRKAIEQALVLADDIKEYLPDYILKDRKLISIPEAIRRMHKPADMDEVYEARRRLAFDEFFLFLVKMELLKEGEEKEKSSYIATDPEASFEKLKAHLPFKLTAAQQRAIEDVFADMKSGYCMNRLLQGDVGSGKTIVAFAAALAVCEDGRQAAVMAPTEVLAKQHYDDAVRMSREYGLCFKPVLLSGSLKAKEKREAKEGIAEGRYNLIIGTHALIQDDVIAKDLALMITDEQHRFGVRQRMSLAAKGKAPHVLVMSATPIPRTLGLILYGDLDVSVINELPAERLPIKNAVMSEDEHTKIYQFIYKRISEGRQAYIICPMVDEGGLEDVTNVTQYSERLRQIFPPSVRIEMLHGKMKSAEKNDIMERFSKGECDILISTTVVEVGVNVPNASVMVVENAERFGLSQLHQLRGRVGRGGYQSYCIFVAGKEDEKLGKRTKERLNVLKETNDGFKIAEEDLKQRGPGDFFGLRQSGLPYFKIADIYTDAELLKETKQTVEEVLRNDPGRTIPALMAAIRERESLSYIDFHGICL